MESVKKFAVFVGLFLGLVGQLTAVLLAFKGDFSTAIAAVLAIAFSLTVVALITIIMSKVPSRLGDLSQTTPRYSRSARRTAGIALVCAPVVLASSFWGWKAYHTRPNRRFVILVADFEGPNPKSFRLSEIVVEEIRRATSSYRDIEIRPVARAITAQEGSTEARKLGQENGAAIVLWGWYGTTPNKAVATIHFEIMSPSEMSNLKSSAMMTPPVSELNNFVMQARIARGYSYVALIVAGLARYEQRDYSGAVDRLSAAEASGGEDESLLDPTYLYFHRGTAFIQLEKQDLAIKDLDRCIARRPDFSAAFINRAVALYDKGQYVQARADADTALRLDPSSAIGYNTRGVILEEIRNDVAALQDFDKALELDPQLSWAYNNRAWIYEQRGEINRAIEDYDRAIAYGSTLALENKAAARYHAGEFQQAISDYSAAINHDPKNPLFYAYRGLAHAALGETAPAKADCDTAIRISPNNARVHDIRGIADTQLGDFENARQDFATALTLDPNFARSYFDRGTMYTRLQDYDSAVKDFTSAIKLDSEFGDAYFSRGEAYQKMGKSHLAFQDFASATHHGTRFIVQSTEQLDKNENSSDEPKK